MSALPRTLRIGLRMHSFNGWGEDSYDNYASIGNTFRRQNQDEDQVQSEGYSSCADDSDERYPSIKLGNLDDDGFPTVDQMLETSEPALAVNKIGAPYKNPEEYFRTHFELMQEDFIYQVRKAYHEFSNGELKAARVYEAVSLVNFKKKTFANNEVLTCGMESGGHYEQPKFGNLLVFTKLNVTWNIFFGMVVAEASQTGEEYSVIRLQFEGGSYNLEDLKTSRFTVLEPDNPFYLSYFCVYNALNGLYMSKKFANFRLAPYILYGEKGMEVKPPEYLTSSSKYKVFGQDISVLKPASWPKKPPPHFNLNKSQYLALRRALTQELALIQGPPGTGKTYFGVQLVQVFLDNNNIDVWNPSGRTPLLVVCHSNHALDHFLEGIHAFTDRFVRVGVRCESEVIKPFCLVEKVCRDLAPEADDVDCTCEVHVRKYQKPVVIGEDEESDEDSEEDELSDEECPLAVSEYCKVPSSKCYCLPALKRCLDRIDKTRMQMRRLTHGIVNFKVLEVWGVIDGNTAKGFELGRAFPTLQKNENAFLKWLGLSNARVAKKNKNADLLISLEEMSTRIEMARRQKQEDSAKKMKDDWNRIQTILAEFKRSSRQGIVGNAADLFSLSPSDARKVYVTWLDSLSFRLQRTVRELERKIYYNFWDNLPRKQRYQCMMKHLQSAHVIGLTSTGAAARRSNVTIDERTGEEKEREGILEKIASPIVIIEEAAQILESHVIVSMTTHCKHLIMLGDHKQLKPNVTTRHLAEECNLNVSLFERLLIKGHEVVEQTCLTVQNRMRPEIADLLRPHIYDRLWDAPPTRQRPNIRGLSKNVFFLNHREHESKSPNNKGFYNRREVEMLLNLSKFLVFQGYLPSQITIISMYNEQRRILIEERDKIPSLVNMEITSVDGFQGKENEIILLSLVRNNNNGKIGFLAEENRICVALSRARSGLYIMGNMTCLTKHSPMWRKVNASLERINAIGPTLNLACNKHFVKQSLSPYQEWHCHECSEGRTKRQKKRTRRSKKNWSFYRQF